MYFKDLLNVLDATPLNYYKYRDMDLESKSTIVTEWKSWMNTFKDSDHKVLRALCQMLHQADGAANLYLANKIGESRMLDMLSVSKEQLLHSDTELTRIISK
ncbi:hypothetical protein BGZ49_003235, partial [Haplosporangium sp. Z 27]